MKRLSRFAVAIAVTTVVAAGSSSLVAGNDAPASSYGARVHSMVPAPGYPGAVAVWVYFEYPMSIDCSPPRACYAKSQWVYAYVNCSTRTVAVMQQISMDLNGNVVAAVNSDAAQFVRGYGSEVRTYASGAPGRVVQSVCGDLPELN